LFQEFGYAVDPLICVFSSGRFYKQSVGQIFDCKQKSRATFVMARPRLVKFAVIDKKHAGL